MKITICGSMAFAKQIIDTKKTLENSGHVCFVPDGANDYANNQVEKIGGSEGAKRKIANDLIRKHYNLIEHSDAILVLNYDKRGIKNYIGQPVKRLFGVDFSGFNIFDPYGLELFFTDKLFNHTIPNKINVWLGTN